MGLDESSVSHSQLNIFLGVPASRRAFRYIFARFCFHLTQKKIRCLLSAVCCPKKLAKDAAPIPNAFGRTLEI